MTFLPNINSNQSTGTLNAIAVGNVIVVYLIPSVVDPNILNLDLDPGFWLNLDPDPGLYHQF